MALAGLACPALRHRESLAGFPRPGLAPILAAACAAVPVGAQPPAAVPPFDVAYRAWELVGDIARRDGEPALAGECGRSFQAVAVPALRRQSKAQQDAAAVACQQRARALCAERGGRTPGIAARCSEFR